MKISTPLVKARNTRGGIKWPKVEEAWKHFFPDIEYTEQHRGADDALHEARIIYELIRQGTYWDVE